MYYVFYINFYVILYVTYCLYNLRKVIYAATYTSKIMNNRKQQSRNKNILLFETSGREKGRRCEKAAGFLKKKKHKFNPR